MLELIIIIVILALDQVSKYLIQVYLSPVGTSLPLIDGVFHLTNVHNIGAAWGMMQGFRWVFIPVTLIVGALILYILFKNRKNLTIFSRITLSLLFAGAIGNLIDRAILGYVRDFFDFCLIKKNPITLNARSPLIAKRRCPIGLPLCNHSRRLLALLDFATTFLNHAHMPSSHISPTTGRDASVWRNYSAQIIAEKRNV